MILYIIILSKNDNNMMTVRCGGVLFYLKTPDHCTRAVAASFTCDVVNRGHRGCGRVGKVHGGEHASSALYALTNKIIRNGAEKNRLE